MKTTIRKIATAGTFLLVIVLAAGFTSCQKSNVVPGVDDAGFNSTEAKITPPVVPAIIKVPAGNKAIWHTYATGFQIYEVTQSTIDPNVYLWTFIAPSATLYGDASYTTEVGIHYVGPTWQATTGRNAGKFVVGLKLQSSTEDVQLSPGCFSRQ